jgi:CRP/FNR family cyclic AMP-dependent transcriptional regulator
MYDHRDILRRVSFFEALTDDEIRVVGRIARSYKYRKNHVVLEEQEVRDALYIVLQGKVKVSLYDNTGKEYIVDVIEEGGFFGELSLFDELTGFVNVITAEPSELLSIRRGDFIRLLMENPTFTVSVLKTLTRKLRAANEKLKGLAFSTVEERILDYLRDIGEKRGVTVKDRTIIEHGPTQIEIASSCGCSRETVSRMIRSLVNKGKISIVKRQYTLRPVYPGP